MKDAIKPTLMQTLEVSITYDACPSSLAFKFHIVLVMLLSCNHS